jgi:hypothetical protein
LSVQGLSGYGPVAADNRGPAQTGAHVARRDVYFCAFPDLSRGCASRPLREVGLPRRHLHEEVFGF